MGIFSATMTLWMEDLQAINSSSEMFQTLLNAEMWCRGNTLQESWLSLQTQFKPLIFKRELRTF